MRSKGRPSCRCFHLYRKSLFGRLTGVKARGNVYRVVFLAAENEGYRLRYGSDEAEQPAYDAATVLTPLRQSQAVCEARLGGECSDSTAVQPPLFNLRTLVNHPVLLGAVVLTLAAALGWSLIRAARRIGEIPKG
jgi:hypothetical protein